MSSDFFIGAGGGSFPGVTNVITTQGDLLARNASTITRAPIGTTGQVLTATPSSAYGFNWADPQATSTAPDPAIDYFRGDGTYGLFETGSTGTIVYDAGGATYTNGASGVPSGISFQITTTTSEVLQGLQSLKLIKIAADATGEGWTWPTDITIDEDARGKDLIFSVSHDGGSANYNGSDVIVEAYDVTNDEVITVRPLNYTDTDRSPIILGFQAIQQFAIQTSDTTEQIRVSFHIESDSVTGSAWDLVVDRVKIQFKEPLLVAPVGDWQDGGVVTITGTTSDPTKGTTAVDKTWYKVVGDTLFVRQEYRQTGTGSAGTGDYLFQVPGGYQVDTSKITVYDTVEGTGGWTSNNAIGSGAIGGGTPSAGVVVAYDSRNVRLFTVYDAGDGAAGAGYGAMSSSSASFLLSYSVPIANASSNIAVGAASTFRMGPILAGGTRVTSTPTKYGEYRCKYKAINSTAYSAWTDTAPTVPPSATNGVAVYSTPYNAAGTANQPEAFEFFVGKFKHLTIGVFESTGLTSSIVSIYNNGSGATAGEGLFTTYDPATGVLFVSAGTWASTVTSSRLGRNKDFGSVTDGYIEVWVSENVQQIGYETRNKEQTKYLSADVTSATAITDWTFSNLTVGKLYEIKCSPRIDVTSANEDLVITFTHNAAIVLETGLIMPSGVSGPAIQYERSNTFVATASTLTAAVSIHAGAANLNGNGTAQESYATLVELNNYRKVSEF